MTESEEVRRHREENMMGEVDDSLIVSGWSITVGDLKRVLEATPDDYEVMLCNAEVDDVDISSVTVDGLYPPALGSVGILRLSGGQIVNTEYAYHDRMDAHHEVGGDSYWNFDKSQWERH